MWFYVGLALIFLTLVVVKLIWLSNDLKSDRSSDRRQEKPVPKAEPAMATRTTVQSVALADKLEPNVNWPKTIFWLSSLVLVCLLVVLSGTPSQFLDGVDTWWQRRQQAKAIAEAKAKEVVWEGEQIIVAPVTDDWSKAAEIKLPYFQKWETTLMDSEDGRWEIQYEVPRKGTQTWSRDGTKYITGPDLTPNTTVRFRSLESTPLEIKFEWR